MRNRPAPRFLKKAPPPRRGGKFARRLGAFPIRAKLTAFFLFAALVPAGVLFAFNYFINRDILIHAANDGLLAAASLTASELDAYFSQKTTMTAAEAQLSNVVRFLELAAAAASPEAALRDMQDFLRSLALQDPNSLLSISLMDARGAALADVGLNQVGDDHASDLCLKNALQSGQSYLSPILFERESGEAYFCLASPVRNSDGKILGVWVKRYSADAVQLIAAKNAGLAGADSYPIVFDRVHHLRLADGGGRAELYKTLTPMSVETNFDLRARNLIPQAAPDELTSNLKEFEAGLAQSQEQPLFAARVRAGDSALYQAAAASMSSQPWTVVFVQPQDSFLHLVAWQTRFSLAAVFTLSLLIAGLGLYIAKNIADPIARLTRAAETIQAGDLSALAEVESRDEIGKLAKAFNEMTLQLRGFIGSLEQRVAERSAALEKARADSEAARIKLEEQVWLANGQTGLADAIRGELAVEALAKKALAFLCPRVGAQAGALFLLENERLTLAGTYCYAGREGFTGSFALGEGLVGQAVADGKIMSADVSSDTLVISTGLGDIPARNIIALPFFMGGKAAGALELATLADFEPKHWELWNRVSESLAYALYAAQTRETLARLLEESQAQAEELQAREEELRAANEELQSQAEALAAPRRQKENQDEE